MQPKIMTTNDAWTSAATAEYSPPDMSLLEVARHQPPPFPAEVFGPAWEKWLRLTAEGAAAPVDYVGAALLAGAASLIGNARWAHVWATWNEPPILWLTLVGPPSAGKSPALDPVLGLLRQIEKDMQPDWDAKIRQWQGDVEAARVRREEWQRAVAEATKSGTQIPVKPDEADEPIEPARPRLVMGDCNEASLCRVLQVQPKGLLLTRDELSAWLGGMDRNGGGGAERAFYLEAWRGRGHTIDRVKFEGKPITIERLTLSVLGGMQPDKLVSSVLSGADDGLSARFLYVWPAMVPFTRPKSIADNAFASAAFNRLAGLRMTTDDLGALVPVYLPLSDEAATLLEKYAAKNRDVVAGEFGLMAGFVGKMPANAVRLALVHELLWWAGGEDAYEPETVSAAAMEASLGLLEEYFVPMGRRSFMDAGLPEDVRLSKSMARWIIKNSVRSFNKRDVYRTGAIPGLNNAAKADAALACLEGAGWVSHAQRREGSAGRLQDNYQVNPLVFEKVPA